MFEWAGTVFGMLGSILVALNNGYQDVGYIFFLIGAVCWLCASIGRKDNAGIIQWLFFTIINIVGLVSYLK